MHDTPLYDVQHEGTLTDRDRATTDGGAADLLVATRVRKEFGGLVASNDVDFTIPRGAIVSLIGPNGAGKTTFFNQLTGVYKPTSGSIVLRRAAEVAGQAAAPIAELGIARTFQNIRLFAAMTVLENVLVGMHRPLSRGIVGAILRTPRLKREEQRRTTPAWNCSATRPAAKAHETPPEPAVRRPAPARDRARAGDRARSCCCSTSRPPA